jgi:hypothetical protein
VTKINKTKVCSKCSKYKIIIIIMLWKKNSKDDVVLTCGVNVWCGIFGDRLDKRVPFLLIAVLIKQNVTLLFIIKRNKQPSG